MVLPKLEWRGTCIAHAYAECLTSRRWIIAERKGDPIDQVPDVSIPWLVQELTKSCAITKFGGQILDISKYIRTYGAPLVGRTERAYMSDPLIAELTNLQDIKVFDLSDFLNSAEFFKVLAERMSLLFEIEEKGPVVGLFNAGLHWPDANGKIYYDNCGHEFSRSKGDEGMPFGPHAALIYGFDNTARDPFDIELLLLDNMGPTIHSEGRARMNISSLRGYIAPYPCEDQSKGSPVGSCVSGSNLMQTNQGENERIMYAVSYMQGWCENVEDYHSAIPELDESTSFFGIYDGHGGPTVALYCAENFYSKILHHADYQSNPENAMKKAFDRYYFGG
ncbi:hypothetical protein C2845_PM11G10300 [Panicum miliaceum]|uniref:protein-serine/threonine phosphatase n=1 Tax=Panicum miliaceum TaxID=4540 RepID=A0A3L6RWI6_PANMI|nr:hypothetical protein C2845_PM11G10300 [Panicum miliaceum]